MLYIVQVAFKYEEDYKENTLYGLVNLSKSPCSTQR